MAIYHLSATIVQRSSGRSAVAAAAYRSGTRMEDRQTERIHDYTPRRGVERSFIVAPEQAPSWVKTREELWNRAEQAERRRDAQIAREINLALPHELNSEARTRLVRRFVEDAFVSRGMVADVAIHHPDRHGDERNYHAHVMLTMRELDGENFAAKKQRDWNTEQTLQAWREVWARYQNDALEEAGSFERVDNRSYESQGIDRMPTSHLGYEASAMERRGMPTRIGDDNRKIIAHNDNVVRLAGERADLDAQIAEEKQREMLAQKRNDTSPMTREEWEAYKRRMQSPFNELAEAHRALLQRGAWKKLTRDMIDADEWERRRGQDEHRERGGRDEPDPEPDV